MDLGNDPCFKTRAGSGTMQPTLIQDSKFLRWTKFKNMRILTSNQKPDTPSSDTVTQAFYWNKSDSCINLITNLQC
jgi:hypothetical protein